MKPALMFAAALIAVTVRAPAARAQGLPNVIEGFFPTQLAAGQTNVLHLGVPGRGDVTGVEINPSAGITVKDIKRGDVREGSLFWEVTVDVAGDAAPGNRTIVAVNQNGRTAPRPIAVYAHVPKISDVKIVSAQVSQPTVQLQFAMSETPNDIGAAPMVWFFLGCGGEPESGVVKGKAANGVVTAAIPNPRTQMKPFAPPPSARCDLEIRASDSKMADSNTLKTTVDFR
ncbi:MAG TPA: hypothetical protein VN654_06020 [Vicinamibacterales bacterium]|nr:hypothetical protein [Vicinamibacterales bacterium]